MFIELSSTQIEALVSMNEILQHDRWALIGASAIRCRLPMQRATVDVDFAVAASGDSIHARLSSAGWTRHTKKLQSWLRAGAIVDVVPATDEDLLAGVAHLDDDFELSVIGFDLAFTETDLISIRDGLVVPVPRLPVLVLLKIVAWLDRPHERAKDLEDLLFMWDQALPEMDGRRWEPAHPVCAAELDYDDQSAFFVGWELGRLAKLQHLHWAKRFLDVLRDEESIKFAQLVRASRYAGDDIERQVRARLTAFERGLEIGAAPISKPGPGQVRRSDVHIAANRFTSGASVSLQMRIHDAIEHRRVIKFHYKGLPRIVAPHVLGIKDGRLQLLTWQTGGASSSGTLPDWRRFFLDDLSDLETTNESFAGPRLTRGRHGAFDRHIAVVRSL